jgi:pimeloyl-ACP methyl ester carboxylesterase
MKWKRLRYGVVALALAAAVTLGPAALLAPAPPAWSPSWLNSWAFQVRLHVAAPAKKFRSVFYAIGSGFRVTRTTGGTAFTVSDGGGKLAGTLFLPDSNGQYPAVLLLHANTPEGRRMGLYRLIGPKLAACGLVVLVLDQRGFGDSDDPPDVSSPEAFDFIGDARRALTALAGVNGVNPTDLHLVGHSFGANIALATGLIDERVRSVTGIGPTRRFVERYPEELDYNRARARFLMKLPQPIPSNTFMSFRSAIDLSNHMPSLAKPGHKPILLIDGEREPERDRMYLASRADSIAEPKSYVTLRASDHYSNTAGFGSVVIYDYRAVDELLSVITSWISRHSEKGGAHAQCQTSAGPHGKVE